jgi:hypothetical protein
MKTEKERCAGKRLRVIKERRGWHWQEVANQTGYCVHTIKKWDREGVTDNKIEHVAKALGFQGWVLFDEGLSEEALQEIIDRPEIQNNFRPDQLLDRSGVYTSFFTFDGNINNSNVVVFSEIFKVRKGNVILKAKLWNIHSEKTVDIILKKQSDTTDDNPYKADDSFNSNSRISVKTHMFSSEDESLAKELKISIPGDGNFFVMVTGRDPIGIDPTWEIFFEITVFEKENV